MLSAIAKPIGSTPGKTAGSPSGVHWLAWSVLAALPWLLPTHSDPWTTFYQEALMAATMLPLAAGVLLAAGRPWQLDALSAALMLTAAIPPLQALGGQFALPAEAWPVSAYLLAMALVAGTARRAEQLAPLRLADALFASLMLAALASGGIALGQWLGVDWPTELLITLQQGKRPSANLGQPNNLASLLLWGLVAVWWAHARRQIGGTGALLAAAFMLLGVALTQSRTGMLAVGLLGAAAVLGHRALGTRRQAPAFIALALWFGFVVLALQPASQLLLLSVPKTLVQQADVGLRPAIWKLALEAIAQHPWVGYGWNQSVQAHVALADRFTALHGGTIAHAHNLVLDLALWNGIPLAAAMTLGLGALAWFHLRRASTAPQALLVLALATFALHAMLELPHVFAFFLLPAAVMLGTLGAMHATPTLLRLPRLGVGVVLLGLAAVLVVIFVDYTRIEADAMAYRFRSANIGTRPAPPPPSILLLTPLQTALTAFREEPSRGMDPARLAQQRHVLQRYPSYFGLFRYAQASALNGQPDQARWAMHLLCALYQESICRTITMDWATLSADPRYPELKAVAQPWN